jgi:hypothetical protein
MIIYANSSYEYWGATASMLHAAGGRDLPVPGHARIYMMAGGQHGPAAFPPPRGGGVNLPNPNDYRWVVRALLDRLRDWVVDGVPPPPSNYPRLAGGALVPATGLRHVEGISFPDHSWQPYGKQRLALVPQVDSEGNDVAGVRTPDVAVPLAAYTGWNPRSPNIGQSGELIGNSGSFLPFSTAKIEQRHGTIEAYLRKWDAAAQGLVEQGFLMEADLPAMRQAAAAKWDWVISRHPKQ